MICILSSWLMGAASETFVGSFDIQLVLLFGELNNAYPHAEMILF